MGPSTRRTFLKQTATATPAGLSLSSVAAQRKTPAATIGALPWYRRTLRWGQTNITEIALTARTTTSTSRPSCARSSSATSPRGSPTTVGAGSTAAPSAIVATAGGSSATALARTSHASETAHTYLRLNPELRARVYGPHIGAEPPITSQRHEALRGFEETDLLPFGGVLDPLRVDATARVLMTFVPAFPIYPPETAWMREPKTDIPGLIVHSPARSGRIAFLPADCDRRFARDNLPDHGNLLANLVRWAANDTIPLSVEGAGLIDCHLYHQPGRLILHLVNLTSAGTWRQPVDELIPIGPLHIRVKLPADVTAKRARLLVAGKAVNAGTVAGWSRFELKSILDHEVCVIS